MSNPPPDEDNPPLERSRHRQPSYRDSEPPQRVSRVEMDPVVPVRAHASVSIPVVLLTTLITAMASVLGGYFASREGASTPNAATKDDVAAVATKLGETTQSVALLTEKQNRDTDDLKNTMVDLKLKLEVLLQRQK